MISFASLLWGPVRRLGRLRWAFQAYGAAMKLFLHDGAIVTLRFGPGRGLRWRHLSAYQPWMALGLYEPEVARYLMNTLREGEVFYDIGANAGYFTLIGGRAVGPSGRVVAFDPVDLNAATTREQVNLNGFDQVCKVEMKAVSGSNTPARFFIAARNANSHLLGVAAPHVTAHEGRVTEVECVTLDSYVASNPHPSLVKVDVEGAELDVLLGARELLRSTHAPRFLITAHSDSLARSVTEVLRSAGYTIGEFEPMILGIPPEPH